MPKKSTRLYLFVVTAVDKHKRINYNEANLLLAPSPQAAANHGVELAKVNHPECHEYQAGVVHEVPQSMIDDIKRLL